MDPLLAAVLLIWWSCAIWNVARANCLVWLAKHDVDFPGYPITYTQRQIVLRAAAGLYVVAFLLGPVLTIYLALSEESVDP